MLEEGETNLERIIAAMAATRQNLDYYDVAVFPEEILTRVGIKCEENFGATPDVGANSKWHMNLVELSTSKVSELANAINTHDDLRRFRKKEVKRILQESLDNGFVERAQVNPSILTKLDS